MPTVGHLKSGLVNFILPCSVAIWSASGTASSHRDRTHSLSHLQRTANQLAARGRGWQQGAGLAGADPPAADLCVEAGVEVVHLLHLLHVGQRKRILEDRRLRGPAEDMDSETVLPPAGAETGTPPAGERTAPSRRPPRRCSGPAPSPDGGVEDSCPTLITCPNIWPADGSTYRHPAAGQGDAGIRHCGVVPGRRQRSKGGLSKLGGGVEVLGGGAGRCSTH